jgi:hypothetical protein
LSINPYDAFPERSEPGISWIPKPFGDMAGQSRYFFWPGRKWLFFLYLMMISGFFAVTGTAFIISWRSCYISTLNMQSANSLFVSIPLMPAVMYPFFSLK